MSRNVYRDILVVGGGIAGISAALEAAESGYNVTLVEKNPYLGGRVAQLYRYFPKLCPPYCGLEINLRRLRDNPRVRFYTVAEVERVSGKPGDFDVTVRLNPRYVNDRCTACGKCAEVCPVDRPDAFNYGMSTTKTIYLAHELAFPMKFAIDEQTCLFEQCAKCVEVCPYDAIDLTMKPQTLALKAGAVIVATGWEPYDARQIDNLGFGRHPDVITNVMMERLAAPNGPTGGKIVRPSDAKPVESAAFIQCAGSRDVNHLGYCSSICCLASLKQATYLCDANPDARAHVFYIDLRAPGTYSAFSDRVLANERITATKGKVAKIMRDAASNKLIVDAEEIATARKFSLPVDLVVLASGMAASLAGGRFDAPFELDSDGFFDGEAGIFAAGCAKGPVDVASAVQDAIATVARALETVHVG
ncbi:MAG: CoB--CoM heterodisulfide reductase iron-sulfur subunit A family protein [Candidatus Eremiobacteraeota bacterium]|nr:CoB--CoM heterodisulfide reductase iron-sulfur subunit A family protein [Candidatus Eremiobacteraeota bacterium]